MTTQTTAKPTSLAEVADDLRTWADTIEGLEGDPDTLEIALAEQARSIELGKDKVEAFCRFIQFSEKVLLPHFKEERDRYALRARAIEARTKRLRQLAGDILADVPDNVLRGHAFILRRQGAGKGVNVRNEEQVPSEYKRMTLQIRASRWEQIVKLLVESSAGKNMIDSDAAWFELKEVDIMKSWLEPALKDGAKISGAELVDVYSVVIR